MAVMIAFSARAIKFIVALILLVMGTVSVVGPMFVAGRSSGLFSAGNMMASGVLLGAGLLHMLADGAHHLDGDSSYPLANFIAGIAFILFLIFEEVMIIWHKESAKEEHAISDGQRGDALGAVAEDIGDHEHGHGRRRSQSHGHGHGHGHGPSDPCSHPQTHHHADHVAQHLYGKSTLAGVVLLVGLSLHSILAGLSMGMETNIGAITSTFIAIVAHKMFAGYALGSTLCSADCDTTRHVIFAVIFASSTPAGIGIGTAIAEQYVGAAGSGNEYAVGCVQSAVAGTFLYIAIIEVGLKELLVCRQQEGLPVTLSAKHLEIAKLACFLFGYCAMAVLAMYV